MTQKNRRRKVLINPQLQWKFILSFTCLASAAVMFEAIVFNRMLIGVAETLPGGGEALLDELNGILLGGMTRTLVLLVPIAIGLGLVATFRVAGPLYGIRSYLERVAAGEESGACHIRERDELHDLCAAVNGAVGALRSDRPGGDGKREEQELPPLRQVS